MLAGGRRCGIVQLIDDHSRYALASRAAAGETATAAIAVVDKAVAAHGVPQRLLSDNGLRSTVSRHGLAGQLVAHVAALDTEAITGKPLEPRPWARTNVDVAHAFGLVLVVRDGDHPGDTITVTDLDGEVLADLTRPAPGIRLVGLYSNICSSNVDA